MAEVYANTSLGHFFIAVGAVFLVVGVVSLIAWVKILTKAGYSGWWVLIVFAGIIPFLGALFALVMFLVFAFSEWPIERQLAMARGGGGGYGPPPGGTPVWSPPPPGGYIPPSGVGYPPAPGTYPPASGTYTPPPSPPQPPPPFSGGTV
jgi:hypothetical protein